MKSLHLLSISALMLALQACGGGNSSSQTYVPPLQSTTQPATNNQLTTDQQELLTLHNTARNAVGVTTPLQWSSQIAADAQRYANKLAKSGIWGEHDPDNHTSFYANGPYGENLFAAYNSSGAMPSYAKASKAWIDEKSFYHYGKIGDSSTCDTGKLCGHYTQIIWKDTSEVGCGRSRYEVGEQKGWYVIVCKYKTPGNVIGYTPY